MPVGPTTSLERTVSPVEITTTVVQVGTDLTTVDHDDARKEKLKASEELGQVPQSTLNVIPVPVMGPSCSSSRDGHYEQVVLVEPERGGSDSEFLTSAGGTDRPGLYLAFPILSPTFPIRSTHISAVGFLLATALVLTAVVYNLVQSIGGD